MTCRLRELISALSEFGVEVTPPAGGGSHWKAVRAGARSYPIPAPNGPRSEVPQKYIFALCRHFDIERDLLVRKLK